MNQIRIRIGVIILSGSKVLLIEHQKEGRTYWLIPGGGLRYGEEIDDCARREIKEETNLDIEMGKFLFLSESIAPDGSRHIVNLFFLGRARSGTLRVGEEMRLKSLAFHYIDDLDTIDLHPPLGALLKQMLNEGHVERTEKREQFIGNLWKTYPDTFVL
ncbi:MAG: NUDIX hydrolase [Candidatus Eremiobacteraeota bacterium]|nr:NUDIX hydrolase [Candidatus Eremiobacteraeota bacterium]